MPHLSDVRTLALPSHLDPRGILTAVEGGIDIPFEIKRVFYMHQIAPGDERGGHAHAETDQVVVGIAGSLKIDVSDGLGTRTHALSDPAEGLFVPRMIWTRLYDFSPGAVCFALTSTHYDNSKVIRSWDEYVRLASRAPEVG